MDAKSKANFINSVAEGQVIPCPKCGAANKPDSKFCISCGSEIIFDESNKEVAAFATIKESTLQDNEKRAKYVEPASVFADGLPSWDILPPQSLVRRN